MSERLDSSSDPLEQLIQLGLEQLGLEPLEQLETNGLTNDGLNIDSGSGSLGKD